MTLKLARACSARATRAAACPTGVRCSEACSVSAKLTLGTSVARKLKVKAEIAKGEAALEGAGGTYVFFDFTRTALKRLFRGVGGACDAGPQRRRRGRQRHGRARRPSG